jgi:uncharacterized phage protein gp47/JayE
MNNIAGLAVSQFGVLIEPGADTESDDNYRERIREKISGPAENGNRQHYKIALSGARDCSLNKNRVKSNENHNEEENPQ